MIRLLLLLCGFIPTVLPVDPVHPDLFDSTTPLSVTIVAPLSDIQDDRGLEDADYRDVWVMVNQEGSRDSLRAELRVRGNFRRRPENCEWPPLKLKVKKSDVGSASLGEHRKFKLVTNCQGEEFLKREYMVYKLYSALSPESFQVRLIDLTLRDDMGASRDSHQLGFLIEDKDELAGRLGVEVLEGAEIIPSELELKRRARLYLFMYMIGNRDWDVYSEKNIVVFETRDEPLAVPFDFDFSGCVAVPYSGLGDYELRSWRDICWDASLQQELRQEFQAIIPTWQAMIQDCDQLTGEDKRTMLRYFRPFFRAAESTEKWQEKFPSVCEE